MRIEAFHYYLSKFLSQHVVISLIKSHIFAFLITSHTREFLNSYIFWIFALKIFRYLTLNFRAKKSRQANPNFFLWMKSSTVLIIIERLREFPAFFPLILQCNHNLAFTFLIKNVGVTFLFIMFLHCHWLLQPQIGDYKTRRTLASDLRNLQTRQPQGFGARKYCGSVCQLCAKLGYKILYLCAKRKWCHTMEPVFPTNS